MSNPHSNENTAAALNMLTMHQLKKQMLHITFDRPSCPVRELSKGHDVLVSKVELLSLNSILMPESLFHNPLPRVTFRICESDCYFTFQVHSGWRRTKSRDIDMNGLGLDLGCGVELRVFEKGDSLTEEELNGMEY